MDEDYIRALAMACRPRPGLGSESIDCNACSRNKQSIRDVSCFRICVLKSEPTTKVRRGSSPTVREGVSGEMRSVPER